MFTSVSKKPGGAVPRDPAINEMVQIAGAAKVPTVWRYQAQHPQCKFATDGVCCRLCHMGPCRITPKAKFGICDAGRKGQPGDCL
jgi:carbon-monoxide dehydrogenase catalytic subunit